MSLKWSKATTTSLSLSAIVEPLSSVSVNEISLIVLVSFSHNLSALIASNGVCKKGRAEE